MKGILLICILFVSIFLFENQLYSQSFSLNQLPLSVAHFSESGLHPGIKIGAYHTLGAKELSKTYRRKKRRDKYGPKLVIKELLFDSNVGFYSHPNNHTGFFTNVGVTFLRTKLRKRRQLGFSIETGYLRRFNKLKTYQLESDGSIKQVRLAGNNALIFSFAPVIAKEITKGEKCVRIYMKPLIHINTYNHFLSANASLELGIVLNINRELK